MISLSPHVRSAIIVGNTVHLIADGTGLSIALLRLFSILISCRESRVSYWSTFLHFTGKRHAAVQGTTERSDTVQRLRYLIPFLLRSHFYTIAFHFQSTHRTRSLQLRTAPGAKPHHCPFANSLSLSPHLAHSINPTPSPTLNNRCFSPTASSPSTATIPIRSSRIRWNVPRVLPSMVPRSTVVSIPTSVSCPSLNSKDRVPINSTASRPHPVPSSFARCPCQATASARLSQVNFARLTAAFSSSTSTPLNKPPTISSAHPWQPTTTRCQLIFHACRHSI